jgi:hypothetical protein
MKRCKACSHESAGAINAAIESGVKLAAVAKQFGISKYVASRHSRICMGALAKPESLETQLETWMRRANDLFLTSGAALDARGQSQALIAGLRALEFSLKHRELEAAKVRDLPMDAREFTPEEGQRFWKFLDAQFQDALSQPYATGIRAMEIEHALARNPELWPKVQALIQEVATV